MRIIRPALFIALGTLLVVDATATAADLLAPTQDSPRYQISNLRTENDRFGRSSIAFDFKRTRDGKGSVSIKGKSANGDLSISAFVPRDESGTIRLSSIFGRGDVAPDIELYFVQSHRTMKGTLYSMVSNTLRRGNPGPATQSRPWTADQKAAVAEFVRVMNDDSAHKPPKEYKVSVAPPDGFNFLAATVKVVKGTKLKACYQNNWHPVTVISENDDGTVNMHWDEWNSSFDCSMKRGELIIENSVASSMEKHPASRFPETVPNWSSPAAMTAKPPSADAKRRKSYPVSIPVPADSQFVTDDMKIKPGTPLQACYAGKWNPLTAISENEDGTLNVHWDKYGSSSDCSMVRSELIIKKKLADPNYVQEIVIAPTEAPKKRKAYKVSIAVPPGSLFVPEDAKLAVGTRLQACWAGKWNPITMLSHATDGSLNVRWDDFGPAYDCSMARNELIIRKETLDELRGGSSSSSTAVVRTWTDATGKFSVKAKLVDHSATEVKLLTDKGKEVTLPLAKLSEADQEFLKSLSTAVNPFE